MEEDEYGEQSDFVSNLAHTPEQIAKYKLPPVGGSNDAGMDNRKDCFCIDFGHYFPSHYQSVGDIMTCVMGC